MYSWFTPALRFPFLLPVSLLSCVHWPCMARALQCTALAFPCSLHDTNPACQHKLSFAFSYKCLVWATKATVRGAPLPLSNMSSSAWQQGPWRAHLVSYLSLSLPPHSEKYLTGKFGGKNHPTFSALLFCLDPSEEGSLGRILCPTRGKGLLLNL